MIDMPARIRALSVDPDRGLPVPWFVTRLPGQPIDFRVADPAKRAKAITRGLCWCCGEPLGRYRAYLFGPMCMITCTSAEPPLHLECAEYSVRACPFITRPQMRRSPRPMPVGFTPAAGEPIDRNPGVSVIGVSRDPVQTFQAKGGWLVQLPREWLRLSFWREGRAATLLEVEESIGSGLPIVEKAAAKDGPEAVAELRHRLAGTDAALRAYFAVVTAAAEAEASP